MVEKDSVYRPFSDTYLETICSNKSAECTVLDGSVLAGKTGTSKNENSPN